MISTFVNILKVPELRKKIGFTILMLCIYRVGFQIPVMGIDDAAMKAVVKQSQDDEDPIGKLADFMQIFTGGSLTKSSLFGLGIMPYISASIIFQLLGTVIPALEKLKKEGQTGHKKIQEYTRYTTVLLCLVQASFMVIWMKSQGFVDRTIEVQHFKMFAITAVLSMTAGTVFLMWLGEQIDEFGIGNGISLIIMAGIVVNMPTAAWQVIMMLREGTIGGPKILLLAASFVGVVMGAILITQGQRRIPIQQARTTRGRKQYGGQKQYLPLRVNHGGVMPIIFASTLILFPSMLFGQMVNLFDADTMMGSVVSSVASSFTMTSFTYNFCYIILIYFFAYFWTTVQFQPKEMATQLRDSGSFIPGLRPGKRTADYLEKVMGRITYVGASFLAVISVVPTIVFVSLEVPFSITVLLGGTGLLIVVSVSLDLIQKIEANLMMRNYSGFMEGSGRIKGSSNI
jgi:preprotein translocase subunit SecY